MKIAILGAGNMGKALIKGLQRSYGDTISIVVFDQKSEALEGLGNAVVAAPELWRTPEFLPDCVVIAVKPGDMDAALARCKAHQESSPKKPLWISIAAGKSLSYLGEKLTKDSRVCRVMPNVAALVGEAMSAFALNDRCAPHDSSMVEQVLTSFGKAAQVPEKLMDAVTGLSGSGPAYVFMFIEALIDGGVTAGLPYNVARECAVQTVAGAARMVAELDESPSALKSKVMSPGGTTAAGCKALEQHAFRHAIIDAVVAATHRSAELGN